MNFTEKELTKIMTVAWDKAEEYRDKAYVYPMPENAKIFLQLACEWDAIAKKAEEGLSG